MQIPTYRTFYFLILNLLLLTNIFAIDTSIGVLNIIDKNEDEISTINYKGEPYIAIRDVSRILSDREPYENIARQKIVLYLSDNRVKVSNLSSFIIINNKVFQLTKNAIQKENGIYVPAKSFFSILKNSIYPGVDYDPGKKLLSLNLIKFNINNVNIEQKSNGTILRVKTSKQFSDGDISSFINTNGWFYLTIKDGLVDTSMIKKTQMKGVVTKVISNQFDESAQLAFRVRTQIIGHEVYQSSDPNTIVVTLRTPFKKLSSHIKELKNRWRLDTVVLDAGHGGKDGGAVGKRGAKEKNIVLDITKRVGSLIEKNSHIKVVYTREEDIFIPLWKRTQIANETNGKLFVSIHVNSHPNRNVRGFETYLLRPGKTDDAIEVASRENSAIRMEERKSRNKYSSMTGENLIMATMAQSMFMKESEDLAACIQDELDPLLDSPNRGLKQAGFYVLIGASMPNVLVEAGYISNPNEERKLKSAAYRQKIAKGIYAGIMRFRRSKEQTMSDN